MLIGRRSRLGARAGRQFVWWLAAAGVSKTGSAITTTVLPLLAVTTLRVSVGQLSILTAVAAAPILAAQLPAAVWADRRSRHQGVVVVCDCLQALLVGSIPLLWALQRLTFVALVGFVAARSAVSALRGAFAIPFLNEVVPRERLVMASGRLSALSSPADIAGPGVAGVMLAVVAAPVVLLLDAVSFVASAGLLTTIRPGRHSSPERDACRRTTIPLREVVRFVATYPAVLLTLAIIVGQSIPEAVAAAYFVRLLGVPAAGVGLLLGLGAVGGIAGGVCVGRLTSFLGGRANLIAFALAFVTTAGFVLPLAHRGWSAVASLTTFELFGSFGGVLLAATIYGGLQAAAPEGAASRAISLLSAAQQVILIGGALTGGFIATTAGIRAALFVAACVVGIAAVSYVIAWPPLMR